MTVLMLASTLLSVAASLTILLYAAFRALFKPNHRRSNTITSRSRLRQLRPEHSQLWIYVFDAVLILSVAPLFLYYSVKAPKVDSIWDLAFGKASATFATSAALVSRPTFLATLASISQSSSAKSRHHRISGLIISTLVVLGIATATATTCSSYTYASPAFCASNQPIRFIIVTTQWLIAMVASLALIVFAKAVVIPKKPQVTRQHAYRASIVADRAPSLSLLIHTQPDPWTRQIQLEMPPSAQAAAQGDPQTQTTVDPESTLDGGNRHNFASEAVPGVLNDFGGSERATDAATSSLGFGSAVASSTNPYLLGSAYSLASRDALGAPSHSKVNLASARAEDEARCQASKLKSPCQYDDESSKVSAQVSLPRSEGARHGKYPRRLNLSASAAPSSVTTTECRQGETANQRWQRRDAIILLVINVASIWCPVAFSTASLLMSSSYRQAPILLASFCSPAFFALFQELFISLSCHRACSSKLVSHVTDIESPRGQNSGAEPSSRPASTSSSIVMVGGSSPSIRNRKPHIRSFSCPLESEMNGYGDAKLESCTGNMKISAKQRQSLASARSVPYLSRHWTAGKVEGDRVVAPRSSFIRGLNLMVNPRPKLEVLPLRPDSRQAHSRMQETARSQRVPLLPASVSTAIVESLLSIPQADGQMSTDSGRTCITHLDHPETTRYDTSIISMEGTSEIDRTSSSSSAQDCLGQRSSEFAIDMDDTPGSPRLRPSFDHMHEHKDLQSPTKRRILDLHPVEHTITPPSASSFSDGNISQGLGNSASRLFSEIMEMVRGPGLNRMSDQQSALSFGQHLKRTPPRGYSSIDGATTLEEISVQSSASCDFGTVIIHPDQSNSDFRTANSVGSSKTSKTSTAQYLVDNKQDVESRLDERAPLEDGNNCETDLVRKGSTSSTLSLASISSRFRSLKRASIGSTASPFGSPSAADDRANIKKMRSRTFASAFGIELGILNRALSKGKRGTPGSQIESSPSTSSGTCPSSLLDLSFSPSPTGLSGISSAVGSQQHETPSRGGARSVVDNEELRTRVHKRNKSRADSIIDMLDQDDEDAMEEILDPVNKDGRNEDSRLEAGIEPHAGAEVVVDDEDKEDEVDLADTTVNDVWERSFPPEDFDEHSLPAASTPNDRPEGFADEVDLIDTMGFKMARLACAPFLDTVEEESEGELDAEANTDETRASKQRDWVLSLDRFEDGNFEEAELQDSAKEPATEMASQEDSSGFEGTESSREVLLLLQEEKRRRALHLLAEHEMMFPHRTLSQIEEVTEAATLMRTSGQRTSSGASRSKLDATTDSSAVHLGLPVSKSCCPDNGGVTDAQRQDADESLAAVHVLDEEKNEDELVPTKALSFVTPRSRVRCRTAAQRKAARDDRRASFGAAFRGESSMEKSPALVNPSPRSLGIHLGQLGMNQGIWMQSPVKLELQESSAPRMEQSSPDSNSVGGSFVAIEAVEGSPGTVHEEPSQNPKLGRRLTLTKSMLGTDSKSTIRKLVRLDRQDSPKREHRDRLARRSSTKMASVQGNVSSSNQQTTQAVREALKKWDSVSTPALEKRLPHKPIKKRRKSRIKGVAVMIARHRFTVVDEDDSLVRRARESQSGTSAAPAQ